MSFGIPLFLKCVSVSTALAIGSSACFSTPGKIQEVNDSVLAIQLEQAVIASTMKSNLLAEGGQTIFLDGNFSEKTIPMTVSCSDPRLTNGTAMTAMITAVSNHSDRLTVSLDKQEIILDGTEQTVNLVLQRPGYVVTENEEQTEVISPEGEQKEEQVEEEPVVKEEITEEDLKHTNKSAVIITTPHEARKALKIAGMRYEGIGKLSEIEFNRVETQLECLSGTLYIPKYSNVLGSRYHIIFMINSKHIVVIDETDFTIQMINRISRRRAQQGETREHFIYNYFTQFLSKDLEMLGRYEQRLMRLEERVRKEAIDDFQSELIPIRKELLELRTYYDEIMDIGKALEENEIALEKAIKKAIKKA